MADEAEEPVTDDDLYEECEPGVGPEPAGKNADADEAPFDREEFTRGFVTLWRNFEAIAPEDQEAKFAAWNAVVQCVYLALEEHGNEDNLNMPPASPGLKPLTPVDAAIHSAMIDLTFNVLHVATIPTKLLALYRSVAHMAILSKIEADEGYRDALEQFEGWMGDVAAVAQEASEKVSAVRQLTGTLEQELQRIEKAASDLQRPIDAE